MTTAGRARPQPRVAELVQEFGREASVFINGPYDNEFRPRFDAMVLAIVCCGFLPRCAIEVDSQPSARMDRITETLRGSKYSIHDLSRCTGEGRSNLGRFNMPFELGIAVAARAMHVDARQNHEWRVMVPARFPYPAYLSDLQGYDLSNYDGTREELAVAVMQWLKNVEDAAFMPDIDMVVNCLEIHHQAVDACRQRSRGHSPWGDILGATFALAKQARLIGRKRAQRRRRLP